MEFIKKVTVSPITLSEEMKYKNRLVLTYHIIYPKFISKEYIGATRKMNTYYEKKALAFKKYIHETLLKSAIADYENSIANGYPVHEYEADLNYTVTYNHNCAISLYMDRYEYTGGAHGNTVRTSQTWSTNNGRQIPLKALFPGNPRYIADIKLSIIEQIERQIKAGTQYFDNYKQLVNKTFDPKNFYLTPGALVIYFQQYDIAPYVNGIPEFHMTYDSLNARRPRCR